MPDLDGVDVDLTLDGVEVDVSPAVGDAVAVARGPRGADGVGVPPGGSAGQVLGKISAADHDTAWIPPGGTVDPEVLEAAIATALDGRLSSGGSIHYGDGPPPTFIAGALVGDVYIDALTGALYTLGG